MKLSMNWLADFTDVSDVDIKSYCDRMTDTGSKVEGYEILGDEIENVVAGRVVSMAHHENSDHLWVCQIDCGESSLRQIVTGAQNVHEGDIVPVARAVAKLPGGVVIKPGKLRGAAADGMLCAVAEPGLPTHDMPGAIADGILILNDVGLGDAVPGTDIREVCGLSDKMVEFEITSNRPDCLSVIGLARETAVSFGRELKLHTPEVKSLSDGDDVSRYLKVDVKATDLCFRYAAKVVKNVRIAPSPLWLRMRLRAAGVRPINNIVDITNYVMLEYGQPMHAFDYACLSGSHIIVRRAADGETFVSLDDKPHTLDGTMLVIADEQKPVALAGVMGGANSEITDATKTVVFAPAMTQGPSVSDSGKKRGMRTESSSRFEKGLDSENCMPALCRACELVQMLDAGDVVDGVIDEYPVSKKIAEITLDPAKINAFLGTDIPAAFMEETLEKLWFKNLGGGRFAVPSFRDDVRCMNDVAEEIIRMYGYNALPDTLFSASATQGGRTRHQNYEKLIRDTLVGAGLDEIQTFSFISPKQYDRIGLAADSTLRRSVVISNPLGEDTSVMRTTLLPSMLDVLSTNCNVKNRNTALFECAAVYLQGEDKTKLPEEPKHLSVGCADSDNTGRSFYRVKGFVEALLRVSRISADFVACRDNPTFHPGRCASIVSGDKVLGVIGDIHPSVSAAYGFSCPVTLCEMDVEALYALYDDDYAYKSLPRFPAVERDFSFVCEETLEIGEIEKSMKRFGGKLVETIKLFDIYRGPQIGEGKKSVSFAVMLRSAEKSLTDEEADSTVQKMLKKLSETFGIALRS
ncbi:MAG: phenylalanine--tRNA ligase subunit beta [Clostridia bacterium]|nr:phenylalanine--tRNA ligase subunit beta [Clostridia bacterium]